MVEVDPAGEAFADRFVADAHGRHDRLDALPALARRITRRLSQRGTNSG